MEKTPFDVVYHADRFCCSFFGFQGGQDGRKALAERPWKLHTLQPTWLRRALWQAKINGKDARDVKWGLSGTEMVGKDARGRYTAQIPFVVGFWEAKMCAKLWSRVMTMEAVHLADLLAAGV